MVSAEWTDILRLDALQHRSSKTLYTVEIAPKPGAMRARTLQQTNALSAGLYHRQKWQSYQTQASSIRDFAFHLKHSTCILSFVLLLSAARQSRKKPHPLESPYQSKGKAHPKWSAGRAAGSKYHTRCAYCISFCFLLRGLTNHAARVFHSVHTASCAAAQVNHFG